SDLNHDLPLQAQFCGALSNTLLRLSLVAPQHHVGATVLVPGDKHLAREGTCERLSLVGVRHGIDYTHTDVKLTHQFVETSKWSDLAYLIGHVVFLPVFWIFGLN